MCEENFYDNLAAYYDVLQEDINPEAWSCFTDELIRKFCTAEGDGSNGSKILCDLGCGNGRLDILFAKKGYDVIGIDSSFEMLQTARETCAEEGLSAEKALFLNQDITEYELFGTADVFTALLDTINHIADEGDIKKLFASFKNYMSVGGIFVFDIGTRKHFEKTLANNVFFEDYEDFTLLWDNKYDSEERINTASLTLFERYEDGTYERSDGTITEKYYDESFFIKVAEEFNLKHMGTFSNLTFEAPKKDDERIFMVFKRETL